MANKYKSQERTGILTPDECVLRELFGIEYDLFNQLGLVNLENTRKVKIDNLEIPKFYRATIAENIMASQRYKERIIAIHLKSWRALCFKAYLFFTSNLFLILLSSHAETQILTSYNRNRGSDTNI
ncbi:MAG: hypothetical protein RL711_383 [Bacteroidota bacterium]